jgi:hypothetical protein
VDTPTDEQARHLTAEDSGTPDAVQVIPSVGRVVRRRSVRRRAEVHSHRNEALISAAELGLPGRRPTCGYQRIAAGTTRSLKLITVTSPSRPVSSQQHRPSFAISPGKHLHRRRRPRRGLTECGNRSGWRPRRPPACRSGGPARSATDLRHEQLRRRVRRDRGSA